MPSLLHSADPGHLRTDAASGSLLEDLLLYACEALQLTPTLHAAAEQHYEEVTDWLCRERSFFCDYEPEVYPQGSFLIRTTTRPILQCEYDLDFVLQLSSRTPLDPMLLLDELEARLKEHGTYKPMVKRLKRCVRLVYAGRFHLDVLPAITEEDYSTRILVPDRELADSAAIWIAVCCRSSRRRRFAGSPSSRSVASRCSASWGTFSATRCR
jgi:hypothetical protein